MSHHPFMSLPSSSATNISHWTNCSISWLASQLQLFPTPYIRQSSQTHFLNFQGDLFYFIFNITNWRLSLDHVFFSSSNKVILVFCYQITSMEERIQLKEKIVFAYFVRAVCTSKTVTYKVTPLCMESQPKVQLHCYYCPRQACPRNIVPFLFLRLQCCYPEATIVNIYIF